ncbi:MAG: ParB/RepB/Spo0J family partition protein, partial [Clostridiales Family XIII bacterium]|nr:ParB/RepB/Spo0J family partition protein [Clostridiales Family XIII bacterium]
DEEAIASLAESIRMHGVIQPVLLRKTENGFALVAGERRWRAARKAGLQKIPSIVRDLSEAENALFAIIENVQREDLTPLEEAAAFRKMIEGYGLTQQQLSDSIGRSRPYITNTLRLLKLPEIVRALLQEGQLTMGHANALGSVKDEKWMLILAKQIAREGLSVREAERLVAKQTKESPGSERRPMTKKRNDEARAVEEELTSILGTRVTLETKGKNSYLHIHFYNREQLEGIIEEFRRLK